ncbi:hypothetical protein LRP67_20710 [Nocardioides sp. cx-169]|uniref:hypothetical protein n=1 Tax=Nocardioides sp. cx-169 TaxID=2899080 RepID=UPI001E4F79F2|nr:hypothetical protein [Nocardioides sp. cx-169]MCD4536520.1 hypothetical protein [Nocardioides sp. cx-169]
MTTHHFRAAAVAAVLAAALLSGCGGSPSTDQVANIPTDDISTSPTPGGGLPSDPSDPPGADGDPSGETDTTDVTGRPVFRLDDTDARRTALINAWSQCLIDHGATQGTGRSVPGPTGTVTSDLIVVADPVPAKAKAACASKLPQLPPETEAETNPDFHAESLAYVGCMKAKGLWVQLLNSHNLDWTYAAGHPVPDDEDKIEHGCLLEAFGGK